MADIYPMTNRSTVLYYLFLPVDCLSSLLLYCIAFELTERMKEAVSGFSLELGPEGDELLEASDR